MIDRETTWREHQERKRISLVSQLFKILQKAKELAIKIEEVDKDLQN